MILLKPTFDVHLKEMNPLKVTALAVTEKGKRYLQSFFKSNDPCNQLEYDRLEDLLDFCYSRCLQVHIGDDVRRGDKRPESQGSDYNSLLCDPHKDPDAAA